MTHLIEDLRGMAQMLGAAGLCGYYGTLRRLAGLIDTSQEGVMESRVAQRLGRSLLDHFGLEVEVSGAEKLEGLPRYCVISNHASYLDWAVLLAYFPHPLRFVAKRELLKLPVFGPFVRRRAIVIDRSSGKSARDAIREAAAEEVSYPVLLFAEGTRSHDGTIRPFKKGGLSALAEAGLTMVPVRIIGTHEALPRGAALLRPGAHALKFVICDPVSPEGRTVEEMMETVERRIREAD